MKIIKIKINNEEVEGNEGDTILHVARKNGIKIPAACFHSDLEEAEMSCRLCLISIVGKKGLHTSCSTLIEEGMEVITESPEIARARKINLELMFSQHIKYCKGCVRNYYCRLLSLAKSCNIEISRFTDRKKGYPTYRFGPSLLFYTSKCIDCHDCVQVCRDQGVGFLEVEKKGTFMEVVPSKDKNKDCVYCGQCLLHCPSGSFDETDSVKKVERDLKNKNKYVVFQFAPSIRSSIGEEFGLDYGKVVTGQLVAGIKKLGANKVFDVSVSADVTTIEEAGELIERIEGNKTMPMFTSCCPSWVKYVEFYYPEFIPNLTSVRSPQIIMGGLIKTYFAKKENIDPKRIVVVSVMPCISKKYEITREELRVDGLKPIDHVLTTRELACMFKNHKIDLGCLIAEEADTPWNHPSGAGVIYGSTGGVTESALRTAYEKMTGKKLGELEFKAARGLSGIKEMSVEIDGKTLKIAVVNGLGNAKKLLERLKTNPKLYDYVEVMSCPGGCIGGGGQPMPIDKEIRKKRAEALYNVDSSQELRLAHENPAVKHLYEDFLNNKEVIHKICHTHYSRKYRGKISKTFKMIWN